MCRRKIRSSPSALDKKLLSDLTGQTLKQSLSQAAKWELMTRNPADAVDPPKVDWKPMQTYDLPQTADLIEAVCGTPIFVPALLAVLCGLRRGEICVLRWRNVDLAAGQLSVVESLEQTKAGLRFKSPQERARDAP